MNNRLTNAIEAQRKVILDTDTAAAMKLNAAVDAMRQLKHSIEQDPECKLKLLVGPIGADSSYDFKVSIRDRPLDALVEYELQHREGMIQETVWTEGSRKIESLAPDADVFARLAKVLIETKVVPRRR